MRNLIKKAPMALALAFALTVFAAVSTNAATLRVDPDGTGCTTSDLGPFATIQGALSAAGPGDTIFVCPNYAAAGPANVAEPYAGPITISIANLTLIGVADPTAPGDSRVLIAFNGAAGTPAASNKSSGIVTLNATGITFGNFTIDGGLAPGAAGSPGTPGVSTSTGAFNGVAVRDTAAGSTVFNTTVRNMVNTPGAPAPGDNFGMGIIVEGGTTATPVSVLNNIVTNFRANGIFVGDVLNGAANASAARALVRGNYVNGNNDRSTAASNTNQRGIVFSNNTGGPLFTGNTVGAGTTGDIFNNRVNALDPGGNCPNATTCAGGIALEAINGNVTVRFNVVARNSVGINGTNTSNITFSNNQIFGRLQTGAIANFDVGLALLGNNPTNGSNFNIIQQNTFSFTNSAVILGSPALDTSAGNTVRQNTFQDAVFGINNFAISTTIGSGATANTFIQVDNWVF